MGWTGRVVQALTAEGDLRPRGDAELLVASYRDEAFDPAVVLRLTDLNGYLTALEPDAPELFPDVSVREGAFRLLLVHLEEALLALGDRPVEIVVDGDGLRVRRVGRGDAASITPSDDELHWTAERP